MDTITPGTKVRNPHCGVGTVVGNVIQSGNLKGYVTVSWERHFATPPRTDEVPADLLTVIS